ncbi:RNA polymerase sigma factor [Marinoscillum sp. MHG1-6]|uniref:RNA polymerase sigma factor n=1 Tax=Marinoscillum sp. MHG1-6 TaxID=2959627 RepID=UPI002157CD87|nr:sigma-70 family RNA polymerase sigma factor [Marinoscillum sp. MHG1-6]
MGENKDIHSLVDHLFRHESGKMVATLTRVMGLNNLEAIQDIVQDTLVTALNTWRNGQLPDNPAAWLYRVARNRAIDLIRRGQRFKEIAPEYAYTLQSDFALSSAFHHVFLESEITDSQLRMIFACCHPSIPMESQVALTLKTLGGLSTSEIAHAFLTNEETINKRIYRAKEKFRNQDVHLHIPQGEELSDRLDSVLKSIYLLFSEGYHSSHPSHVIREDLCHEAMRLCLLLAEHPQTNLPRTYALMSLMCFQASRLSARLDDNGHIVLMKYQDRERWFRPLIEKGHYFLRRASEPFEVSTYHLEAIIASIHASASSFESTDWKSIYGFYEKLNLYQPNPVVALNKAIAAGYALGYETALQEISAIDGLYGNPVYQVSLGEIYHKLGQMDLARKHYEIALNITASEAVRQLIQNKLSDLG